MMAIFSKGFGLSRGLGLASFHLMAVLVFSQGLSANAADKLTYICPEKGYQFSLQTLDKRHVRLTDGTGNKLVLKRKISASGEQFTGLDQKKSSYDLALKGKEGMLTIDGKYTHKNCKIQNKY